MALTVEDGTGLPEADAFVSVEDCDAYCTAQGLTGWTGATRSPPDDDEAAIRRATAWLSTSFAWKGSRALGRVQALAWPRSDATDGEELDIDDDEVPIEVVQATCIAAAFERANPGGLMPTVTLTERIKREKVGPLETEYAVATPSPDAAKPVLTSVAALIDGLLSTSGGNPLVGSSARR